ncbi:hypothetical protein BFF78_12745 [Streptomyces fodineus]|uniref:Uncharacterized protein n=1 Tax=Streptomyces fodineus TaxID=1904616 RepID=A0A1D7Y8B7_9ACTN|nr:hypothetical protein [Streptomyces fodineus]AOR31801.1 hypothetical protein BFF78_12745 [Streptomyces fodineus]
MTRITRNRDESRAERCLGLASAVVSAAVVVGGVMLPAVAASAAPMHQTSEVIMAVAHGDYYGHQHHHDHDHCGHHHKDDPKGSSGTSGCRLHDGVISCKVVL